MTYIYFEGKNIILLYQFDTLSSANKIIKVSKEGRFEVKNTDRNIKKISPRANKNQSHYNDDQMNSSCLCINIFFFFTATTPWFEIYREKFLQMLPPSDHEFLNHCLGCILSSIKYSLKNCYNFHLCVKSDKIKINTILSVYIKH